MNEGFFIVFRWDLEQCLEHGIAELLCIGFSPVFFIEWDRILSSLRLLLYLL